MTWLAISGAHGVGKSTLIDALPPDVARIGNVMRGLAATGMPVGPATSPATIAAYLRSQTEQQLAVPRDQHMVSDRALVDGAAYVLAAVDEGIADYSWSEGELELLLAAARLHAATFDAQLLVPAEFSLALGDPLHVGGGEYQGGVERRLEQIFSDWPIPVVRVTGTVEERLSVVHGLLNI